MVHYDSALELAPDNAEYYYHCGVLCDAQDDVTQAQADYDKALELDSDNTQALLRRSTPRCGGSRAG